MTSQVTSHVLDAVSGRPASGVRVALEARDGTGWRPLAAATTDADGRVRDLGPDRLPPGVYRVLFDTGGYFAARGASTFYPEVAIVFELADAAEHYHVPLLVSPYAYSTYRGS